MVERVNNLKETYYNAASVIMLTSRTRFATGTIASLASSIALTPRRVHPRYLFRNEVADSS